MEYVAPGAPYSSRFSAGPSNTGLVGTIRFQLLDNDNVAGDPVQGPLTAGILEDPVGSGDYVYPDTLGIAPAVAGHYSRAWDFGSGRLYYDDDLLVSRTALTPFAPSGNEYVTVEELKIWLELEGDDTDGHERDIQVACEAASRCIDGYLNKQFYSTSRVRLYTARWGATELLINDLAELDSIEVDYNNDGSFEPWVEGTNFYLNPEGAADSGYPYTSVQLLRGTRFPYYDRTIRITGSFGWPNPPANVKQAAKIWASRLFKRRETPYAILTVIAADEVANARLGKLDPDVAMLLQTIPGLAAQSGLKSVRLA
jgi:hypothetical protein